MAACCSCHWPTNPMTVGISTFIGVLPQTCHDDSILNMIVNSLGPCDWSWSIHVFWALGVLKPQNHRYFITLCDHLLAIQTNAQQHWYASTPDGDVLSPTNIGWVMCPDHVVPSIVRVWALARNRFYHEALVSQLLNRALQQVDRFTTPPLSMVL